MSTPEEHEYQQALMTAACEAGTCHHPECRDEPDHAFGGNTPEAETQTFDVLLALTVRAYGTVEIKAKSAEAAAEIALEHSEDLLSGVWSDVTDPNWSASSEPTIVTISDSSGTKIEGIELSPEGDSYARISVETLRLLIKQSRS